LRPGGGLFVYSHVRKKSPLAGGLKQINRLARGSRGAASSTWLANACASRIT